jgi:Cu(I)/Ag(I) efflux system membrane fusion protein
MKTTIKTYLIGGLLFVLGIFLGVTLFSSETPTDSEQHEHAHDEADASEWTCSMHPQIRQDEPGDCPICGMDLIPASSMEDDIDADAIKMSKTARKLAGVETLVVGSKNDATSRRFSGRLEPNQNKIQSISANFDARIERLYVNEEGESVKKGQVIAELYAPEIEVLKDEWQLAKRQQNELLQKSIERKITNYELSISDVESINNGRLKLKSPITGVVADLQVKQGDNLRANQNLMNIADLSSLWAVFDVYENDLNKIKLGDEFTIQSPSYQGLSGKVTFISPVVNEDSRSAKARIVLNNPNLALKPGVFITAESVASTSQTNESLRVPKSAVLWTGKRSVVYQQLENENGVYFKMLEVEIGNSSSDEVEVISGLQAGDEIVSQGAFSIDSEAQLANKPSMMNPDGAASSHGHHNSETAMAMDDVGEISWKEVKIPSANFQKILQAYLSLKEALAEDEEEASFEKAKQFYQEIKAASIEPSAAQQTLLKIADQIQNSKDMESARQYFQYASDILIDLAKQNNPLNETLYVQFCPMANNDNGAFWLSTEEEIKNPYYGSMMLRCGNVEEEIE